MTAEPSSVSGPCGGLLRDWQERGRSWAHELTDPMMERVLPAVACAGTDGRILDLGCGEGETAEILADAGMRIVAMDVDRAALLRARRRALRTPWLAAVAERLPFADGVFDVVYAVSVLQYTDRARSLAEIARVLRPGGLFLTVENLHGSPMARAARVWIRATGRGYAPFQTPLRHLRRREVELYREHFTDVEPQCFNLLTAVLWAGAQLVPVRIRRRFQAGVASSYRRLHAMDRAAFRAAPRLESYAWHVVITGRRRA